MIVYSVLTIKEEVILLDEVEAAQIDGGKGILNYIGYAYGYIAQLDWTGSFAGD